MTWVGGSTLDRVAADAETVFACVGLGAGVTVIARRPRDGAEAHRPGRASRHPRQRATGRPDVVDPVGDVEEAVDGPLSAGGLRQGRLTWARQAEIGPRSDAQQVEVRITRDLAGEPEQEGGE